MRRPLLAGLIPVLLAVGCADRRNDPIPPPTYDPVAATDQAFAALDKNSDGALDPDEVGKSPGLKAAFAAVDTNKDRKISRDELKARLERYQAMGVGAVGYSVKVTFNDAPLAGAEVQFVPEPFLKDTVKPATATTGADGTATSFSVGGDPFPGLPFGMYRIEVTKPGADLPPRYNTQTTLGCEVFGQGRGESSSVTLALGGR